MTIAGDALSLSIEIDIDLDWNGHAKVRRTLILTPLQSGEIPVEDLVISIRLDSRDIIGAEVSDPVGGMPKCRVEAVGDSTILKIWPGFPLLDSPYEMFVEYRHQGYAIPFGKEELVFGIDNIIPDRVDRPDVSNRQTFKVSILLPRPQRWWLISNPLNDIRCLHRADKTRIVFGREQLEWEFGAISGDPAKRLFFHYTQYRKARLVGFLNSIVSWIVLFTLGIVAAALKPQLVNVVRQILGDGLVRILGG